MDNTQRYIILPPVKRFYPSYIKYNVGTLYVTRFFSEQMQTTPGDLPYCHNNFFKGAPISTHKLKR